ncbi:ATP-dependent DNA helicase UvrD2 [Nesterenkonia lacusekhoensis]|uniref:DNA 3'-5' helicase n=1 Tax=Nesterenkonia lacusekhoensis TaxID=150832 RepID=A0ABS4T2K4_9MICC|nr:ATP-dependent DNA helicase UvrD2 [Nesterenkonia lacusekhoensis]MBP2318682.1 DNA helicase-2/ATP-dependent DNA helicase PcrA [Nesterenkonia lacusekhoensis]
MTAEEVLEGLDEEQRQAASTLTGPLCILAGAGTGKTRAITHRIAYGVRAGVYDPHRLLAVTFTARAAAEMRSRLNSLGAPGVQARTFHAAALRQLQYFWPLAIGGTMPQILDHKVRLLAEAARRLHITTDRASLRDLAGEIEWAKVSTLTPDSYLEVAEEGAGRPEPGGVDHRTFAKLYQSYEDVKLDKHLIDFEDVLLLTVGILEDDERVAAQVRQQYRHFVVDEYQDVSPLQQRLLDLWLGGREEICVVGDAAQTIYSFTGATPDFLLNFTSRHKDATVVKLIRDYRSTPEVVQLANTLLSDRTREQARLTDPPAWPDPLRLVSQKSHGPTPQLTQHAEDDAEASWIAEQIGVLQQRGVPLSEIAVLYRTNGQSQAFEQALAQAGISYQLRGSERFFSRAEVREALAALRTSSLVEEGGDTVPEAVRAVLSSHGWRREAPETTGAVRERWESMAALVSLADQLDAEREDFTMKAFLAELEERSAAQHAPTVEGVTLASLHSAKGLEWDAVFLAGLNEGLMPITFAKEQKEIDEERRLFYVGITRARTYLSMSSASSRHSGGRGKRQPSRFLRPLRQELGLEEPTRRIAPSSGSKNPNSSARSKKTATCSSCGTVLSVPTEVKRRRCSECPARYDEALFERLREWRSAQAKELEVPAFMVFTDATLEVIAEKRPRSDEELLKVPGVGRSKLEKHGESVKQVLADSL